MCDIISDLLVVEFSSIAIRRPIIVTIRAESLEVGGMVSGTIDVGGIFIVRMNPVKMLPKARRMIGLIRFGWFSLIGDRGRNRGWFSSAK